jgi:membrane protease subunit HflK
MNQDETQSDAKLVKSSIGCLATILDRVKKYAPLALLIVIILGVLFSLARAAVYKIRPWERGLHVRGGRFIGVDEPGWHIQIPFVDTVIGVVVSEQLGEIDQLAAMTSDEVTMDVSLLYTYRVIDPKQYRLEVLVPEEIIARFVSATLRDVINTKQMSEVMDNRAAINFGVIEALTKKEFQYGIEFVTVQLQSASPPGEVVTAIKDRMVALQRQEQSEAEAAQLRTLADAEFYSAQKEADANAYELTKLAEANAQSIDLTSKAELEAMKALLEELQARGDLADKYIQLLIAKELRENSKWILGGSGEFIPRLELD